MPSCNNSPTIGILIPTYNRLVFLREALASVLRQTYFALDIVVMDDGSSDGTAKFMSSVSDSRLRYYVNDCNLGLAGNINRGVSLLSNNVEWFSILCDDDILAEDFVESMVKYLGDEVAHTIIRSSLKILDVQGTQIRDGKPGPPVESAIDYMDKRFRGKRETYLTGLFLKRTAFNATGGYPQFTTGMAADDALIFVLALHDRLHYNPNTYAGIRFHDEAESHSNFGALRHVQALQDFTKHCAEAAAAIDMPTIQLASLNTLLVRYARKVSSDLWIRSAGALFACSQNYDRDSSRDLFRFALQNPSLFTARVIADARIANFIGMFPEQWSIYRSFWRLVTKGRL